MWTSRDEPPVVFEGDKVRANQGNWVQGQGLEPLNEPRYFFSWAIDGGSWSSPYPPSRTRPLDAVPGVGDHTRELLPGVHKYTLLVAAGSLDPRDGGWIEWGWKDVRGNDYRVDFDATGPGAPPPPPPPPPPPEPRLGEARRELDAAIQELAGSLPVRLGWGRPIRALAHARAARRALE
jgi:hypothetical protein